MIDYLCQYETVFDQNLNVDLMTRAHDKPLLDYILECWKSLEVIRGVKIIGWEYTDKESEIDINKYIFKRERGKKKNEKWQNVFVSGFLGVECSRIYPVVVGFYGGGGEIYRTFIISAVKGQVWHMAGKVPVAAGVESVAVFVLIRFHSVLNPKAGTFA